MSTREACFNQGLNHFAKRENDEAIVAFKKAIDLDAEYADAYLGLAQTYDQKGLTDEAITTIARAIELNPKEPLYHTSLSVFYRKKGMIPEAEAEMAQAVALQRGS